MNTRRTILALLLFVFSPAFAEDKTVKHVNASGAAALVDTNKVVIVDVRSADEFSEGHIKGAKNIDFRSSKFEAGLSALDKGSPVLVHCASGGRSTASLKIFAKLGFTNVTHLDDGFEAWKAAGLPVAK